MSRAVTITSTDGNGQHGSAASTDLPLNDPRMRGFVRDLARGRPGVVSELRGAVRVWFPVINGERIPCERPYPSQRLALATARDFRDQCRAELARD